MAFLYAFMYFTIEKKVAFFTTRIAVFTTISHSITFLTKTLDILYNLTRGTIAQMTNDFTFMLATV
jgi:hypothetical protein